MPITLIENKSTLKTINSNSEKTLSELEKLYPDYWMLLEVTDEKNYEPRKFKVIAIAKEEIELIEIWKKCRQKGMSTALIRGVYTEPQPTVVI